MVATLKDESQQDELKLKDTLLNLIRSDEDGAENVRRENLPRAEKPESSHSVYRGNAEVPGRENGRRTEPSIEDDRH